MKIEISNATASRLVINSLKLVIPAYQVMIKEDSILADSDIQELIKLNKLVIKDVQEVEKIEEQIASSCNQECSKTKKIRKGKTTPKNKASISEENNNLTKKTEIEDITNQMGRKAFVIEQGQVTTKRMSSGYHNVSEPKILDQSEKEEKNDAFVDIT